MGMDSVHRSDDRMSWERTGPQAPHPSDKDQILVFGYSAKLFKDDVQAELVEQGRHLVPWQGQADVRIDRFDVRGCLSSLKSFEPDDSGPTVGELELEQKLDDERFRDLVRDEVTDAQDEEMRRLREELAADGAYNQVAFSYGDSQVSSDQITDLSVKDDCDLFRAPENLKLPPGLNLPKTMREHKLIEKTASFIHTNGPQMEIVLKIKQSSNPAFAFLDIGSPLNQYFKYILSVIKSGSFVPNLHEDDCKKTERHCDTESDDDDGGYLHPSLMGGRSSNKTSSSSIIAASCHQTVTGAVSQHVPCATDHHLSQNASNDSKSSTKKPDSGASGELRPSKFSILPPPPHDVQIVIDKLAERVAQDRGEKLESTLRLRADPRFEFLNPGNCFHAYYVRKKLHYIEQKQELIAESKSKVASGASCSSRNITFSFAKTTTSAKDQSDAPCGTEVNQMKCQVIPPVAPSAGEQESMSAAKKLQEERKRKAALFFSLLKSREQNEQQQPHPEDKINDREHDLAAKSVPLPLNDDIRDRDRRGRRPRSRDRDRVSRDRSSDRSDRKRSKRRHRSRSR